MVGRSDNWRINKSGNMPIEGANIIRSLTKVAGAAGLDKGYKVRFATQHSGAGIYMEAGAERVLYVGGAGIFTEAPMPAQKFDVLVGMTLHEVGHFRIDTQCVWNELMRFVKAKRGRLTKYEERQLRKFTNIAEDIAVEAALRANPNLADYEEAMRNWFIPQMDEASSNKLLDLWAEYALGHKANFDKFSPDINEPMSELIRLTRDIRTKNAHARQRASWYAEAWDKVRNCVIDPPPPVKQNTPKKQQPQEEQESMEGDGKKDKDEELEEPKQKGGADDKDEDGEDEEDEELESGGQSQDAQPEPEIKPPERKMQGADSFESLAEPMSEKLMEAIEQALEDESDDISEQVMEEVAPIYTGYKNPRVTRKRETKSPTVKADMKLSKQLTRILTIRKRLLRRDMHGELYGRIDKRHLDRIATDQRVFKQRFKFPDAFPKTKILLDLSGSMSGKQAEQVLEAAGALTTVIDAEVWTYADQGDVTLTRVDDGKLVHTIQPNGGTPSGLAMSGVAIGMRRGDLIIHLTDGHSNVDASPDDVIDILHRRGIEVVNLLWGGSASSSKYQRNIKTVTKLKNLAEFPDALYGILINLAKLGGLGGK